MFTGMAGRLRKLPKTDVSTALSFSDSAKKSPEKEYSKRMLDGMIRLWFCGAFFGMGYYAVVTAVLLFRSPETVTGISLDGLWNYIGLPIGGGVVTYLVKSAYEKTRKNYNRPFGDVEVCPSESIEEEILEEAVSEDAP